MKLKNLFLISSVALTLSNFAAADDSSTQEFNEAERPMCCLDRREICREPYPPYYSEETKLSLEEDFARAISLMSIDPIFIGGARYTLDKSKFNAVYKTRYIFDPCFQREPIAIHQLAGYEISFPVDGDFGQNLIFDINGRSDRSMTLSASCGSFSASDSGSKYVVSRRQTTNGSCKTMNIKFDFPVGSTAPSFIDLNVTISEEL